jgi:hypothetical protein
MESKRIKKYPRKSITYVKKDSPPASFKRKNHPSTSLLSISSPKSLLIFASPHQTTLPLSPSFHDSDPNLLYILRIPSVPTNDI